MPVARADHRDIMLIEEDVFKEHRKLKDLKEPDAKARYTKGLTSLATNGITYVLAKV